MTQPNPSRKLLYVLPNAFTVGSIFCGFYAISLAVANVGPAELHRAAIAILLAMLFDGFDGRVARMTRTQSEFGTELDSLADVISFGVAPALVAYQWVLRSLGPIGLVLAFAFATCGALRLARFNVLARRSHGGASKFFVGLPIPLAAGAIASIIIAHTGSSGFSLDHPAGIGALVAFLSYLMVSNIKYRTFKDAHFSKKSLTLLMLVLLGGALVAVRIGPSFVPAGLVTAYLIMGLAEELVFFKRRRAEAVAARAMVPSGSHLAASLNLDAEEEDEDEIERHPDEDSDDFV